MLIVILNKFQPNEVFFSDKQKSSNSVKFLIKFSFLPWFNNFFILNFQILSTSDEFTKKKSTNIRTRGKILLKYIIENEIVKKNSPRAGSSMVSHKKKRWNKVGFFMFVCLCTQYYKFLRFDASMLVTREYLLARLVGFKNRCIHFTLRGFVLNAFEYYSLYHLYSLEVTLAWSNV